MFLDWFELLCFCLSFFWWFISSCFGMIWQWLEWSFVLHLSKFCILRSVDQRGDLMGFTLASLARGKWPSSVKSSSSRFNSSIRLTARFWCVSTRKCWIWWWEHFNSIPMGWLGFSSVKVSVLVVFLFGSWCAEDIFCPVQWASIRDVGPRLQGAGMSHRRWSVTTFLNTVDHPFVFDHCRLSKKFAPCVSWRSLMTSRCIGRNLGSEKLGSLTKHRTSFGRLLWSLLQKLGCTGDRIGDD